MNREHGFWTPNIRGRCYLPWSVASALNNLALDSLLDGFSTAASAVPDSRKGPHERYAVTACFSQAPSLRAFQQCMENEAQCSDCLTLFGV